MWLAIAGCGAAPAHPTVAEPAAACRGARDRASSAWRALAEALAPAGGEREVPSAWADLETLRTRLNAQLDDEDEAQFLLSDSEAEQLANALMDAIDARAHDLEPALRDRAEDVAERMLTQRRGSSGAAAVREAVSAIDELERALDPAIAQAAEERAAHEHRSRQAAAIATAYEDDVGEADQLSEAWSAQANPDRLETDALSAARAARESCPIDRPVRAPSL